MNRPTGSTGPSTDIPLSIVPQEGWHCSHLYYRIDRGGWKAMDADAQNQAREEFHAIVEPQAEHAPQRLQASVVSGHKADFGLMLMDPDPLKIDRVHQLLLNSTLGPVLTPCYSFVSLSEISEYVPTLEQYGDLLVQQGVERGSPAYDAKLNAYAQREPMMRHQRLTPEFPQWPVTCFYPMNKKRKVGENWFLLPFEERQRMMAEHARSGMQFAGRVTQLITVGVGLDDWEWGVTLWAKNPEFLKDIVYTMRFDEASARYAEFGPFYVSYIMAAHQVWQHCFRGESDAATVSR